MADRGTGRSGRAGTAARPAPRRPRRPRPEPDEETESRPRRRSTGKGRTEAPRRNSSRRPSGTSKVLGLTTTRRAAVIAIVVCALAFTIAVPLRTYLEQRSEVSEQEQRKADLQREVDELQARQSELADPAQIEAEARRRLRYVMPGETPYMVQLPEDKANAGQGPPQDRPIPPGVWYERLWATATG